MVQAVIVANIGGEADNTNAATEGATGDDNFVIDHSYVGNCTCCCFCCRVLSVPEDACMCLPGKFYPNGAGGNWRWLSLVLAQVAMLIATAFSIQAVVDCDFVRAQSDVVDEFLLPLLGVPLWEAPDRQRTSLGFFFFQDTDGSCAFDPKSIAAANEVKYNGTTAPPTPAPTFSTEAPTAAPTISTDAPTWNWNDTALNWNDTYASHPENAAFPGGGATAVAPPWGPLPPPKDVAQPRQELEKYSLNEYIDYLGNDWNAARSMALITAFMAITLLCLLLSYTCLSHTKRIRQFWVTIVLAVLCPLQAFTLLVLASDGCKTADCIPGRAAWGVVVAVPCYALAAALVLTKTRNYYPGVERYSRPDGPIELEEKKDMEANSNDESTEQQQQEQEVALNENGLGDAKEIPVPASLLHSILSSGASLIATPPTSSSTLSSVPMPNREPVTPTTSASTTSSSTLSSVPSMPNREPVTPTTSASTTSSSTLSSVPRPIREPATPTTSASTTSSSTLSSVPRPGREPATPTTSASSNES